MVAYTAVVQLFWNLRWHSELEAVEARMAAEQVPLSLVCASVLLKVHLWRRQLGKAAGVLRAMQAQGIAPDAQMYFELIRGFRSLRKPQHAERVLARAVRRGQVCSPLPPPQIRWPCPSKPSTAPVPISKPICT